MPLRIPLEQRDKSKYYCFYRNYNHDTKECHDLKYQTEELIRRDHLRKLLCKPHELSPRPQGPVEKQIVVIFHGLSFVGEEGPSGRKAYA